MAAKSTRRTKLTRRQALRAAAGAAGGLALAGLPSKWTKPVVKGGALPAHAAASCFTFTAEVLAKDPSAEALIYVYHIAPTSLTNAGGCALAPGTMCTNVPIGFKAVWQCVPGCLQVGLSNDGVLDTTVIWQVTMSGPASSSATYATPFTSGVEVLVNLTTGQYSTTALTLGTCRRIS